MSALSEAFDRAKARWDELDPALQDTQRWLFILRQELDRERSATKLGSQSDG